MHPDALSTIKNFGASSTFAIMICVGVPIWDRRVSAKTNVEDTLWLCLASAIGVVVMVAVEQLFSRTKPGQELVAGVADRLAAFDDELARTLEAMADRIEGRDSQLRLSEDSLARLERAVGTYEGPEPQPRTAGQFCCGKKSKQCDQGYRRRLCRGLHGHVTSARHARTQSHF